MGRWIERLKDVRDDCIDWMEGIIWRWKYRGFRSKPIQGGIRRKFARRWSEKVGKMQEDLAKAFESKDVSKYEFWEPLPPVKHDRKDEEDGKSSR